MRTAKLSKPGVALLLMFGLCYFALAGSPESDPFSRNESEARRQLLVIAPVGSDVRRAKLVLESRGFACAWIRQYKISGADTSDTLYCDLGQKDGLTICRWQLSLMHTNYAVTNANVGFGLIGP